MLRHPRTAVLAAAAGLLLAASPALATAASPAAAPAPPAGAPAAASATSGVPMTSLGGKLTAGQRATLRTYARDTWKSFVAMVDPATGLPSDNIGGDLDTSTRSAYTSPTNIGGYIWSTVAARDLGIIGGRDAEQRIGKTLDTLGQLKRHEASGMFYNWYNPDTGAVLRIWPDDGSVVHPFLSSVDNGWLAAALMIVRQAVPAKAHQAEALLSGMDFGFFYNPEARGADFPAGLLRGGFWDEDPGGCTVVGNYRNRGPDVWYTCNHYDITNTEPRIASYIGIALGQIPAKHYFATNRTFPTTCDWDWLEQKAVGFQATYLGVPVFDGAFSYGGQRFVPTWGGDMFEAMMPAMFVPEEKWGPKSWGLNHPAYVQGQIVHGLYDAKYGYWGFSPASDPRGGYTAWGVDEMGMDSTGYVSDLEATNVDNGFPGCRDPQPKPTFGDGVVTPHASFLALPFAPVAALDNLTKLQHNLDAYGPGGFYDAIAVRSNRPAKRYLSLDQAMILGPIENELNQDALRRYFTRGEVERAIKPLLGIETFNAKPGPIVVP